MAEENTASRKHGTSASTPVNKSIDAPTNLNGSQDAPSVKGMSITQSKGRSKRN